MKHSKNKKKGFKISQQQYRKIMIALTAIKNIVLVILDMTDKH